jgi:hypothetical protein
VFSALPLPWTTTSGPDHLERVRVTKWRGLAQRDAWRRCHGQAIEGAPDPGANAAHETDSDPDPDLPRASDAAPDLLANPDPGANGNADADASPDSNPDPWYDANPHAYSNTNINPVADSDGHTDADSTANAHADSTANAHANPRPNTHTHAGTNANSHSSGEWYQRIACRGRQGAQRFRSADSVDRRQLLELRIWLFERLLQ